MEVTAIVEILMQVVGLFSLVATMTPNQSDNIWAQNILNAINALGANVGKARNQ